MATLTITELDVYGGVLKTQTLTIPTPVVLFPGDPTPARPFSIGFAVGPGAPPALSAPFHGLTRKVQLDAIGGPATVMPGMSPRALRNGIVVVTGGRRLFSTSRAAGPWRCFEPKEIHVTKGLNRHVGTPVIHKRVRPEDGHRGKVIPPRSTPKPDSGEKESAEAAYARRLREGGKD